MTAAYTGNVSTPGGVLQLAFELGWTHWVGRPSDREAKREAK